MSTIREQVGFMNPFQYVIQDSLQIPNLKDQEFGRVLDTRYESLHLPYAPVDYQNPQVVIRIFCDNYDNLFMSANCIDGKGELIGNAARIPIRLTSHGNNLRSGGYVNATERTISDANLRRIKAPLLEQLEERYMNSLYKDGWWHE